MIKQLQGVHERASAHWVGDGFPVRTMFPSAAVSFEQISPFLLLDYAGPQEFGPSEKPRGVEEHPHRGFETVTIVYQGSVSHRDSGGNAGTIGPGDVQWMTAASGVVHEEMHERDFSRRGGTFEVIQLWVNLPRASKMSKPKYQGLTAAQIPAVDFAGGSARVIAGEFEGAKGPANTFTPVNLWDVKLEAGSKTTLRVAPGFTTAIFLRSGDLVVNGKDAFAGDAKLAVFAPAGDEVTVEARKETKFLVLNGEPIREPVAQYGPFVMNTREELMQAIEDYRAGRMGHLG